MTIAAWRYRLWPLTGMSFDVKVWDPPPPLPRVVLEVAWLTMHWGPAVGDEGPKRPPTRLPFSSS